jgi:chromosome segregation ATPase
MFIEDIKSRLNPMERKKLDSLKEEAEQEYQRANFLDKERQRMLKDLQPKHQQEMQEAKNERNQKKEEIREKIRSLKEERKVVNQEFLDKVRWIKDKRKKEISENKELSKNLKEKREQWDKQSAKWEEYHRYYEHLVKKYQSPKTQTQGGQE